MQLQEISLMDVRNLNQVDLVCSEGINIIHGKNAAGKTAILEGIHMLARASSFRTPCAKEVIQHGKERLTVVARGLDKNQETVHTGLETTWDKTQIRYRGERVKKRSEQAGNIPVITITPESHRLIYGSPRERRHWLDWSLFHVEQGYMDLWHDYHHALRQRNALLRKGANDKEFISWERVLAEKGAGLRMLRETHIMQLGRYLVGQEEKYKDKVSLSLSSRKDDVEAGSKRLAESRAKDRDKGYTQQGAHREDVKFQHNGIDLGKLYSRGEGKRFVLNLLVAQTQLYQAINGKHPLLLIDDLTAELDQETRALVLQRLDQKQIQTFITVINPADLAQTTTKCRLFHVEQGKLINMVE